MIVTNRPQLYIGLTAFGAGGLLYFLMRPFGATYLQKKLVWIDTVMPHMSGLPAIITGSLFEFIHPFSFSLIGMGLVSKTRMSRFFVCFIFMLLNLFCEFGQRYKGIVIPLMPDVFYSLPLLAHTKTFFSYGTFDWLDVVAIASGSLTAFVLAECCERRMTNG